MLLADGKSNFLSFLVKDREKETGPAMNSSRTISRDVDIN